MNTRNKTPLLSSQSTEWYTPPNIVSAVVKVMGTIDLDLCSNSTTHPGLAHPWHGRVFMNPPYGREIGRWVRYLVEHL